MFIDRIHKATLELPQLTGKSPKQIAYGEDCRDRAIAEMKGYLMRKLAACPEDRLEEMTDKALQLLQDFANSSTSAKEWIEPQLTIAQEAAKLLRQKQY